MRARLIHCSLLTLSGLTFALGCSSGDSNSEGIFESASPTPPQNDARGAPSADAGANATGGTSSGSDTGSEDAGRAIEEADIIKLENDQLYALSRYGGLSVIDVKNPERLRLLGRHKVVATPFEMYVRDGIVMVLYNGYGEYTYDEASDQYIWTQTSTMLALDARDPGAIVEIGEFTVPGAISDSRIIGDIMYVAAFEDGYCWGCSDEPRTSVLSLDVSDPANIVKVDELSFSERVDGYSWRRSLTATDQRLYIAGPRWGANEPTGSLIQVVDVSDPTGDMQEGTTLEVNGQIQSRWQMDEYQGVLRVVSQPFTWNLDVPPKVETFTVASAQEITPLGSTSLTLPRPEQLQSVRFDGTRGYAITFERTDPLFTIDLSDPAAPEQKGALEIPGWVYHMEPRGDRLIGLGFDQSNPDGALAVSLFDVSDLSNPTQLDRVNFGGDWAYLAEDQDRIHKSFNILDSEGLILVPFAGWNSSSVDNYCGGDYISGVQLIDWTAESDDLALQGVAPTFGQARRGFLHQNRLFTVSDERVESFDIHDRSAPERTSSLPLAQFVSQLVPAGDHLVRIGQNWWTQKVELDVTSLETAADPGATARLELDSLSSDCYGGSYLLDSFGHGNHTYLVYQNYRYDQGDSLRVVTVDISDPLNPKQVADASLGIQAQSYYTYGNYGLVDNGEPIVNVGNSLAILERTVSYDNQGNPRPSASKLHVLDMSTPKAPKLQEVALPSGLGGSLLHRSGNTIATSHYEASPTTAGSVRFYLDRVDISNPSAPVRLPSINVPGSLLAYDAQASHAITIDYRDNVVQRISSEKCYERGGTTWFEPYDAGQFALGQCHSISRTLHLLRIEDSRASIVGSHELGSELSVGLTSVGTDRFFATLTPSYGYYGYPAIGCAGFGYCGGGAGTLQLLAIGGLQSGTFGVGEFEVETGDSYYGYSPLVASGQRALLSTGFRGALSVVDASNLGELKLVRETEVGGYVQDLVIMNGTGVAALGYDGVATIPVAD